MDRRDTFSEAVRDPENSREMAAAAGPSVAHEIECPLDYSKQTVELTDLKKTVNDISLYQNFKLINLIGRKCLVYCLLEGVPVEVWYPGWVTQFSVLGQKRGHRSERDIIW